MTENLFNIIRMGGRGASSFYLLPFIFSRTPSLNLTRLLWVRGPPPGRTHSKQFKLICFLPNQTHEQVRSLQVTLQEGLYDRQKDTKWKEWKNSTGNQIKLQSRWLLNNSFHSFSHLRQYLKKSEVHPSIFSGSFPLHFSESACCNIWRHYCQPTDNDPCIDFKMQSYKNTI